MLSFQEDPQEKDAETLSELQATIAGKSASGLHCGIVYLSVAFAVFGLHYFPGFRILGTLRIPLAVTILAGLISLPYLRQKWGAPLKLFALLLVAEGFRGMVGMLLIDSFVVNDAWHFYTWRALVMLFVGLSFPIAFLCASGARLRMLAGIMTLAGFALSLWVLTHSGFGPGGFLHDENDTCLVLVAILPMVLVFAASKPSAIRKLISLSTTGLLLLGSVATQSRGGFLGLVAVALFQFYLSPKKIQWVLGAVLLMLVSIPFIPEKYYSEVQSIGTESTEGSGTIQERFDTWKTVFRMWSDPKNMPFGVGLENSKYNLGPYQSIERGRTKRSLAGRATHSLYFQVLGDLGIWGIVMYSLCFGTCIIQLRKVYRHSRESLRLARLQLANLRAPVNPYQDNEESEGENEEEQPEIPTQTDTGPSQRSILLFKLQQEASFVNSLSIGVICSWFGALGAAVGISVAYYSITWFLLGLSVAVVHYWTALERITTRVLSTNR